MDNESVVEQIVRSLSFEVEAVPQDNIVQVTSTSKSTPVNLKIKVRRKNEAPIKHGFISVPKSDRTDNIPDRIRLVSSDQTLMNFDVLMETDLAQKPLRKPRKHIFDVFRPGSCLGTQQDDDNYSYMPKSEGSNSRSDGIIKQNVALSKINDSNMSTSPTRSHKHKTFFGKCKPGGCLDPPFSEDKYSYKPATLKQIIPIQDITKKKSLELKKYLRSGIPDDTNLLEQDKTSIDSSSLKKAINKKEADTKSILSLYQADSMRTSTTYSNSIITYPPAVTSNELRIYNDKNLASSENRVRNSINESAGSFYVPPKKVKDEVNQLSVANISNQNNKMVSKKDEDINKKTQNKSIELSLVHQDNNELNSKKKDTFERNIDFIQIEAPELDNFSQHQLNYELTPEKTSLGNTSESESSFGKSKIKPNIVELSTKIVSSDYLNIVSHSLTNGDNTILETHPEKNSRPMDSQQSVFQDDQLNKDVKQNETHNPVLSIQSLSHNDGQMFGSKTDGLFGRETNNISLEAVREKIHVTENNDTLLKDTLNLNREDIDSKDNMYNKETVHGKNEENKDENKKHLPMTTDLHAKDIEKQSFMSDTNALDRMTKEEPADRDKNTLSSPSFNNVLDIDPKDDVDVIVLQNAEENVTRNEQPVTNTESMTSLAESTSENNKVSNSAQHSQILSEDSNNSYDSNNLQMLDNTQELETEVDIERENLKSEDHNKNDLDIDELSEASNVVNLKKSNIEENFNLIVSDNISNGSIEKPSPINSLHEIKTDDPNNVDTEKVTQPNVNSHKRTSLETPHSSKQDTEKNPEEHVLDINNAVNSKNSINESLQIWSKEAITVDDCINSDISIIRAEKGQSINPDTKLYVFKDSEFDPIVENTSNAIQAPTRDKNIFGDDKQLSVEVDLAFESYLNNNKRVLKSFNSENIPKRFSKDSITIIKSQLTNSNEIKIPIDSENDLSIKIKKARSLRQPASKFNNEKHRKKMKNTSKGIDSVGELEDKLKSNTDLYNHSKNANEAKLRETLIAMYEKELIPLQNIIKELKEDIDVLTQQKNIFNDKLRTLTAANPTRLIKINKKCGCLRKQL